MKFLLFFLVFLLTSCSIRGLTSDYKKSPRSIRELVVKKDISLFHQDTIHISKVTGKELNEELQKHEKAIVFLITPYCVYDRTVEDYKKYAEKNGYSFFLVADSYADIDNLYLHKGENQLFVIDHKYYKTNLRHAYTKKFVNELKGVDINTVVEREGIAEFYFFVNGKLTKQTGSI